MRLPVLLSVTSSLFAIAVSQAETKVDPNWSWGAKMRAMETIVGDVLVDASSDERYTDPKNKTRIADGLDSLATLAQEFRSHIHQAPEKDPSIEALAQLFAADTKAAAKHFRSGDARYARGLIRGLPSYCISCHTRNDQGPNYESNWQAAKAAALKPIEQIEYYAATRQFGVALETLNKLVAQPTKENVFDWERAVRAGLAIQVRVKKDPQAVISFVDAILKNESTPSFIRSQAERWREDALAWKKEKKSAKKASFVETLREGNRIFKRAKERQAFPMDRSSDVEFLRASSYLHDALNLEPGHQEALYLLGLCYEVLKPLRLWELQEYYYLNCFEKNPKSEWGKRCFQRYEENVYLSYTGSSGTNLPDDVELRLEEMKLRMRDNPARKPRN